MTKILVTGGAGFIGSHLCDRLVAMDHDVIVVDNLSSGDRTNLADISDSLTFIEADIRDIHQHAEELAGVELVFHLAALISGYDSLKEPRDYIDQNLNGLTRLLDVIARLDTSPHIVFASSSTVYGNAGGHIRTEGGETAPMTMYAMSKHAGEQILAMYADLHGYTSTCLRLFNVYGPRQNADHPYANVTCKFSRAAALEQPIKLFGDGEQTRDFIYIDDIIDAFILAGTNRGANHHAVYNVGTGEDHSILSLVETLEEISGRPFDITRCDPWPNDIRKIRADISRIHTDHGFRARTNLRDGLAATVEFFAMRDSE